MRPILLLAFVPLTLAACEAEVTTHPDKDGKVAIAAGKDGAVSFDLPFAKGELKLPATIMSEANFEIEGVKMVPGGTVTGFNVDAGQGQPAKVNLTFSAPTAPDAVRAYFVEEFRKRGVTAAFAGDALRGATQDGDAFLMRFGPEGSGTAGTIEIVSAK